MRKSILTVFLVLLILTLGSVGGLRWDTSNPLPSATTLPMPADPQVQEVVKILRPSVVGIQATAPRGSLMREIGLGTGVIVRKDGLIVTNDHVITLRKEAGEDVKATEPANRIDVILESGKKLPATIVARMPGYDLAFLEVEGADYPPAVLLSDLGEIKEGGLAVAIGGAPNLEQPITTGHVTKILHNVRFPSLPQTHTLIRSNVPLTQGNSGGPLADARGRVIGINVAITLSGEAGSGASLSIPAPDVVKALENVAITP